MIKTSIELIAENIGFDIANSDDQVQGDLFNGLGKGFKIYQKRELELQLAYISNKLTKDAESFILEFAEIIKHKNQ